eukprot:gene3612-biopygen733
MTKPCFPPVCATCAPRSAQLDGPRCPVQVSQDTGAGVARARRGRGAGVAQAWRGRGAGLACDSRAGVAPHRRNTHRAEEEEDVADSGDDGVHARGGAEQETVAADHQRAALSSVVTYGSLRARLTCALISSARPSSSSRRSAASTSDARRRLRSAASCVRS